MSKKDYILGFISGLLSGVLALPVLKAANPELYLKINLFVIPLFIFVTFIGLAIAIFISIRFSIIWQIAKFGVIGMLNTLIDFSFLTLLTVSFRNYINVESNFKIFYDIPIYSIYKSTSFVLAVVNSYFWNKHWTFPEGVFHKNKSDFFQFLLISIIGFGINVGVSTYIFNYMKSGRFNIDQWGLLGAGVGSLLGLGWNFIGYKFIVFKKQETYPVRILQ